MPSLLSVKDCSEILKISTWTIRRFIKRGQLPAVRIGSRILVKASDLISFIDQRTTTAVDQPTAPGLAADEEMG